MTFIGSLFLYTLILIIWFKTEAFIEYSRLFKLNLGKIKDYGVIKESDPEITYLLFLREYFDCFFVRLITCPICAGTMLGVITSPLLIYRIGWWAPPSMVCLGLSYFYLFSILMKYGERSK